VQQGTLEASSETQLTIAIADFVHSKGLSFLTMEGYHFAWVLKLAKQVSALYIPPRRRDIGTTLLDMNYLKWMERYKIALSKDGNIFWLNFGLSMFGDGATVKKMPLMNMTASGVHKPVAVMDIF
jgi:hypothetical protein